MIKSWLFLIVLGFCTVCGCGYDEADFISGARRDPCNANTPVCNGTAGCSMGEWNYIEGDFPGFINFLVTTPADTTIVVKLFFKDRKHPGEELEIIWYEPGCRQRYVYSSYLEDIFKIAGGDSVLAESKLVREPGDHLIEIYCDAWTHFFVRVELITPM